MIELYLKYYDQLFKKENNQLDRSGKSLNLSPQSPTEAQPMYDPTTGTVQLNQPNNALRSADFKDSAQSDEEGENVQQDNIQQANSQQAAIPGIKNKINWLHAGLIAFIYASSIYMIIYGCIHWKDCPAAKWITISYIVVGCLMLLGRLLSIPEDGRSIFKKQTNPTFNALLLCRMGFNLLVVIAMIGFFFTLCYWAFHITPDHTEGSSNYCEKVFYKNTYNGCIAALTVLALMLLCLCGFCVQHCRKR